MIEIMAVLLTKSMSRVSLISDIKSSTHQAARQAHIVATTPSIA